MPARHISALWHPCRPRRYLSAPGYPRHLHHGFAARLAGRAAPRRGACPHGRSGWARTASRRRPRLPRQPEYAAATARSGGATRATPTYTPALMMNALRQLSTRSKSRVLLAAFTTSRRPRLCLHAGALSGASGREGDGPDGCTRARSTRSPVDWIAFSTSTWRGASGPSRSRFAGVVTQRFWPRQSDGSGSAGRLYDVTSLAEARRASSPAVRRRADGERRRVDIPGLPSRE